MTPQISHPPHSIPSSPPPSFRSRASSPVSRHLLSDDPLTSDADRTLEDTFNDGSDSDNEQENNSDDRQHLIRGNPSSPTPDDASRSATQRLITEPPILGPVSLEHSNRPHGVALNSQFSSANDGVFANLNAKPERGEKTEEQPPVGFLPIALP